MDRTDTAFTQTLPQSLTPDAISRLFVDLDPSFVIRRSGKMSNIYQGTHHIPINGQSIYALGLHVRDNLTTAIKILFVGLSRAQVGRIVGTLEQLNPSKAFYLKKRVSRFSALLKFELIIVNGNGQFKTR